MEDMAVSEQLQTTTSNIIPVSEFKDLKDILAKYDIIINNIYKCRSAYKVETPEGYIFLKKMSHGKYKCKNGYILVEELYKNNFYNVPRYIKTKDGRYYVKHKNHFYYVTEWIDGQECNLDDLEESKNCIKLLANFHKASQKIDTSKLIIKNNLKNWPYIFKNCLHDLERYKKLISNKKIRNDFDLLYGDYIENFYNRGLKALSFLNNSNYYKLSRIADNNKTICHDSFYYQNIIKTDSDYFLIDLDSIIIDLQINDLGKIIRRLMYKKNYAWNFNKVRELIECYNSINKLSKNELEVMLALIIFPHKFWKLGKKRYLKKKDLNEKNYLHRLKKLIKYDIPEEKFLQDYLEYLNNYDS